MSQPDILDSGLSTLMEEIVISHYVDPDFGALELIETRTEASVNGGPMRPLVFRHWAGKQPNLDSTLIISASEDPPVIDEEIRTAFRDVTSNIDDFTRRIARTELQTAKSWIAAAKTDLALDEDQFAGLLKICGFTIGPRRLTVWVEESANIFDGHSLEVRIEKGQIIEIRVAG
jgi:hypothetical protein